MRQQSGDGLRAKIVGVGSQRRVILAPLVAAGVIACSIAASIAIACSAAPCRPPSSAAPTSSPVAAPAAELASSVLTRPDLAAYHGWIKYLSFQAEQGVSRAEAAAQRDAWSSKILANPALIAELRGVFEWAYLSPADGSGQPFLISIPARYDGTRALPLSVHLHGLEGTTWNFQGCVSS